MLVLPNGEVKDRSLLNWCPYLAPRLLSFAKLRSQKGPRKMLLLCSKLLWPSISFTEKSLPSATNQGCSLTSGYLCDPVSFWLSHSFIPLRPHWAPRWPSDVPGILSPQGLGVCRSCTGNALSQMPPLLRDVTVPFSARPS